MCTVTSLANATPCTFSITATNTTGPGLPSTSSMLVTPVAAATITTIAASIIAVRTHARPAGNDAVAVTTPGGTATYTHAYTYR